MDVCLVTGVPEDHVPGRDEDAVQGECHLHHAEVGAEMTAGRRHLSHEELADLLGQVRQVFLGDLAQVLGRADPIEQTHAGLASRPRAVVARLTGAV